MSTIKQLIISLVLITLANPSYSKDIKLLTSIKPLQLIAAAIQQDITQPEALLPIGASPHHYALRPADITKIQTADLLYWIGPDMEVFLTKPISNRTKHTVAIQQLPTVELRHFDANESHDSEDHDHQAGSLDPHLWLSPANAKAIATQMADDLSKLDPANKLKYQQNLQSFLTNLAAADKTIRHYFTHNQLKPFFVFHETYDYFEETYGIKHKGVFSINANIQPGARHIAEMREQLKAVGASCIFYEPPVKPKLADTLIKDLTVDVYMLDAMGADISVSAEGYPKLLNHLAKELLKCQAL